MRSVEAIDPESGVNMSALREKDLVFSIILIIVGCLAGVEALRMPVPNKNVDAPGLIPLVLAVVLIVMGLALMYLAVREGGGQALRRKPQSGTAATGGWLKSESGRRTLTNFALVAGYVMLIGVVNFYVLSLIFVMLFTICLKTSPLTAKSIGGYVVSALVLLLFLIYFFRAFNVRLP